MANQNVPRDLRVGFIGYGAVASTFAVPMLERGAQVYAYDLLLEQPEGVQALLARPGGGAVHFCGVLEVAGSTDLLLSTAATHVALPIAEQWSPHLRREQVYVDLNSTAPSTKQRIAEVIAAAGADFCEGAILGAVGTRGARTQILLCGSRAQEVAKALCDLGLNAADYGPEVGRASTFKMLRSIFSKGLEALLVEFLVAARTAGLQEVLWSEVCALMARTPWEQLAEDWVVTHAVAHERRAHEMAQVVSTMRDLGVEPLITGATAAFFERSAGLGLSEAFPERPGSLDAVIAHVARRLEE